jgi:hypothetical protein
VVQIKTKCFCGLTDVYYRCCDVNKRDIDDATRENLRVKFLCCGARCIKIVSVPYFCKKKLNFLINIFAVPMWSSMHFKLPFR